MLGFSIRIPLIDVDYLTLSMLRSDNYFTCAWSEFCFTPKEWKSLLKEWKFILKLWLLCECIIQFVNSEISLFWRRTFTLLVLVTQNTLLGCDRIGVYGIRYTVYDLLSATYDIQVMQRGSSWISSVAESKPLYSYVITAWGWVKKRLLFFFLRKSLLKDWSK